MPSSYAVGRTDAGSPRGGFLLQGFAVCVEGLEDEAAVDCGPREFQTLVLCLQSSSASLLWKDIY